MARNGNDGKRRGWALARLIRDVGGNTLVIMAMAMAPMSALAGSAVDMSRLYLAKVRLQQACDAGALAGRKYMTTTALDATAKAQADKFFGFNFPTGWFGTTNVSFDPKATADGQVAATAKATVPMVIMQAFGKGPVELVATCEARLEIPNTDIMFVLDTTGSMACSASDSSSACSTYVGSVTAAKNASGVWGVPEKADARIKALRTAVLDFYDTISTAIPNTSRLRIGFVPYTSNVNVGRLLPAAYLVGGDYHYQSRTFYDKNNGSATVTTTNNVTQSVCDGQAGRSPTVGNTATVTTTSWTAQSGGKSPGTCVRTDQPIKVWFHYANITDVDVSNYVKGLPTQNPTTWVPTLNTWNGCIEERDTVAQATFTTIPAAAYDMDIDLLPTNDTTRWRPTWPDIVFDRNSSVSAVDSATNYDGYNYGGSYDGSVDWKPNAQLGYASCPKAAAKLAIVTRAQVNTFVNGGDFLPHGGTYHDTGMIWGARLLSPTGIFAAENSTAPNGNPIGRHIIFMTDGDMAPNLTIDGLYGVEALDQRVTGGSTSQQKARHNARFNAMCDAARKKNITIWVVAYAQAITPELTACADPGKAFAATSDKELQDRFKAIATQIAELRLSK